jgi:malate synthase
MAVNERVRAKPKGASNSGTKSGGRAKASASVRGAVAPGFETILTTDAVAFVAELEKKFGAERRRLLAARKARQGKFDAGELPDFLPETAKIRSAEWRVAPAPADLQDRRVEITGPVDRKMIINALNSGANVFVADFEDSCAPTWDNLVSGQINVRDAVNRTIDYADPASGKKYRLNDRTAVLIVRPRGWHLPEVHVEVNGEPMSGSLFDAGLFLFHNAKKLLASGSGPYLYLPKMESHREAKLWDDVLGHAEKKLGVPHGAVKCTVLIETFPAAFEMDEILHALKDRIVGLNCGRWDFIFSFIKTLRNRPEFVLPDRGQVTMDRAFLRAYSKLLIDTCHRRGAHAMGGMTAQIPIKNDTAANDAALAKVKADKEREASDGHDGTWVAHPGLVQIAKDVFDRLMPKQNQVSKRLPGLQVRRDDLYELPKGAITEAGLRANIRVGVQYIGAWLRGNGCVPLYNLMEDAATAEISRTQIWQWLRHGAKLDDGRKVEVTLFDRCVEEEMAALRQSLGPAKFDGGRFKDAIDIFSAMSTSAEYEDFLTLPAYQKVLQLGGGD